MKKAMTLCESILLLIIIGSLFVCAVSAEPIIIDTEKGVTGFRTEPARDLPANWQYVQDHQDTSADGWFDTNAYPPGQGNGSFWYTISFPDMGECKGIWETSVPYTGKYEIFAWIPSPDSFDPYLDEATPPSDYLPTKRAQYKVFHNDGVDTVTIDQNVNRGRFTSLGVFVFDSTARVELSSNGVEFWRCVAFDAVTFVPVVHDMAVIDVSIIPPMTSVGQSTAICVTVTNEGSQQEENVSVKALVDGAQVGSTKSVSLDPGSSDTTTILWIPRAAKNYSVEGEVGIVRGEMDIGNNTKTVEVRVSAIPIPKPAPILDEIRDTTEEKSAQMTASEMYTFVTMWPELPQPWYFRYPCGIAVDSSGNVYVVDTHNNQIQKFDSDGTFITKWGSFGTGDGEFSYPKGIAVDSSGYVYVCDCTSRIQKFDSDGTFITKWGRSGTGDGEFYDPQDIAVDSSGNVYLADRHNERIQKFDSDGTFITKWGVVGTGDGEFHQPSGIAVDNSGNVFVADTWNDRIQKFDSDGNFITKWGSSGTGDGEFDEPEGIAVDSSGNVYVVDTPNNQIQKFDSDGTFITKWGSFGTGDGEFSYPRGIAVDSSGYVYVCDSSRIQKFDSDGTFITKWGSSGTGDGEFYRPYGIAVDSSGNVFVADTWNDRIQKFDSAGTFLIKWGSSGTGDGEFYRPYGIAVDSSGYVYVADSGIHRIQKFDSDGNFITKWGSYGSGDGEFSWPHSIAVDSSGYVYVADTRNYRIQKFDSDGNFITKGGSEGTGDGEFARPHGIAVDNSGYVYVADTSNDRIQKFDSNINFITKWGSYGSGDGEFHSPEGIVVDSSGYVYVADSINDRIQKFDSNINFITKWGSYGSGDGEFSFPGGVAVDSSGYVYVADTENDRIQKFELAPNNPPTANANGPYYGNINEQIQFYGTGIDPDGDAIIAYAWDFNNNGITDSTLQNPTHLWSSAGTYYPTLKVQDERGAWSEPNECTVLITTPPSYGGALTGVHQQPNYMAGKTVSIGADIKNTGGTDETYDLHLVVCDKYATPVYDDTINGIYLSSGAKTSREFSSSPLSVGYYSFSVKLKSSSSGNDYDDDNGGFSVLDRNAIQAVEDDAESLKHAAFCELDEMITVTSTTFYEASIKFTWGYIKDVLKDKIVGLFSPQLNLFTGMSEQNLVDAELTAGKVLCEWENAIEEFGEGIGLKSGLKRVYRKLWTLPKETNIVKRDTSFTMFIIDKPFTRNDDLIQVFSKGKSTIQETLQSSILQEEMNDYEYIKKLEKSLWFNVIKYISAILLVAAVILTIVSGVGAVVITAAIPVLKSILGALSILPKIGAVAIALAMVAALPYVALEVTIHHDHALDIAEMMIEHQTTSTANVFSLTAGPQSEFDKETKFSMTIDKDASNGIEPIIGIVVSPDGRVIDMSLYQTDPLASDRERISSSIRLPHQPGKYKILAMTMEDMMKSSVKQVETTQTAPNVSVSISSAKPFYNFSETVTITANFTNTAPEKAENMMFSIDVLNTTYNKTGFLEIEANSSKIETLNFVPETNGTYKATVTLFAGLYVVDTAETGFTVEFGEGVSVNVDSKEVYDPNTNVTANLTIKNVGTETYTGIAAISTVDTLNDYFEVYNTIESLSVNVSEEKVLQCVILPKESVTPGIYRSYVNIDDSTYIIPFTVAANGTIFITVQTDKLIYSASESVIVNISVNDVAFNATNATLNMSLTDPYGNKDYFVVTGSNGNYSAIITPDHKSVNGTYTILVNGTKEDYRLYSDQTFFIVNERTGLRCDIPRVIQLNTTDTINLFVETDTNLSLKDAFVTLTGCGFNGTRTTDEIGLVVFGTSSMNKTGVINVSIEKGGYGSLIGKMKVIYKKRPPIASFTYSPEKPVINQTITFNASNSTDLDGNITKYDWNFGDGYITNTTEAIINHTYSLAGDYIVNLTVTDNDGAMNSTEKTITVYLTVPPEITSFAPPSQVNDTICTWRTFNVTIDQTVNVSWYLNGTLQHTNVSVREAKCSLHAAVAGEHNVTANASNANGTDMQTWVWNVAASKPPEITAYAPESAVNDSQGATRTFNITIDQTVNVSWQINGTEVQTNESVTEASYTNLSAVVGTWNISAIVNNANGTDMQMWVWTVEPSPCFIATAAYGTALHEDINVLRAFRDEYLMPNPAGRAFVKIYYSSSPPLADLIRENEGLRTVVRGGFVEPLVHITEMFV